MIHTNNLIYFTVHKGHEIHLPVEDFSHIACVYINIKYNKTKFKLSIP